MTNDLAPRRTTRGHARCDGAERLKAAMTQRLRGKTN